MGKSIMPTDRHLDYLKRSGDRYIDQRNYEENNHGFASWTIAGGKLLVLQVYGDGEYWDNYFRELAAKQGLGEYMFYTRRNPKAFARKYNASVVETLMSVKAKT